jgi:hypothetical protein
MISSRRSRSRGVAVKFYIVGTIVIVVALVTLCATATFITSGPDKPHATAPAPQAATDHPLGGAPTMGRPPPGSNPIGSPAASGPTYATGITGAPSTGAPGAPLPPGLRGPSPGTLLSPGPPPVVPPIGNGVVDTHTISR